MIREAGQLFISFSKVGLFGFGGGQALVPIIEEEVVDSHHWLTEEEFTDALAVGNALPGPITVKLAVYVGMNVTGLLGALAGLLGLILPIALAMGLLSALIMKYRDSEYLKAIFRGLRPAVIGLLVSIIVDLTPPSLRPLDYTVVAILIASFLMVNRLHVHPVLVILCAMVVGLVFYSPWLRTQGI